MAKSLRVSKGKKITYPIARVECKVCGERFDVSKGMAKAVNHRDKTGHSLWEAVR